MTEKIKKIQENLAISAEKMMEVYVLWMELEDDDNEDENNFYDDLTEAYPFPNDFAEVVQMMQVWSIALEKK